MTMGDKPTNPGKGWETGTHRGKMFGTHIHTHKYTYIFIYVHVYVCVSKCIRMYIYICMYDVDLHTPSDGQEDQADEVWTSNRCFTSRYQVYQERVFV